MKKFPLQIRKTDEEANLREVESPGGPSQTCLWCKFFSTNTERCSLGHNVTDCRKQVCDEWRYVA